MTDRVKAFFQGMIPVRVITKFPPQAEPAALAQQMDVDRVATIMRQAEAGDTSDLFALYRDILVGDSHLQGEFNKRKLAVLGDPMNLQPYNKAEQADVENAKLVKEQIDDCASWLTGCAHLLNGSLWPVALIEKTFRPSAKPGVAFELAELVPVPDQLLDFTTGKLRIKNTDQNGLPTGTFHEPDPNRYIIHRGHLLTVPDNWGGPMRSLVWWWLLSAMDRDWWARFLDRYAMPFLLGKYDQNDDPSRSILERAFSFAVKVGGLIVSKETDVEIKQAATSASGDAYERFLTICQREKSKLIVGHTLSAEAQPTGLGSGQQSGAEAVRQDIRQFDAMMLGATLRLQLFEQILRINSRGGRPPKPLWGAESYDNSKIIAELLGNLKTAGLEPTDQAIGTLSERLGFDVQRAVLTAPAGLPFSADLLWLASVGIPAQADDANRQVARRGAADLSRAFRGALAPVRQIILSSQSPQECEARLRALYADWSPERVAPVIEQALAAHVVNATLAVQK
jgi:phage gp29-like protein